MPTCVPVKVVAVRQIHQYHYFFYLNILLIHVQHAQYYVSAFSGTDTCIYLKLAFGLCGSNLRSRATLF